MRSMVIALCVLGMPCLSSAQAANSSWTNLNALRPGQKLQLVEMNSKKDNGIFVSVTDAAITLQQKSGEQTFRRQDVRIVRLMKNKHRLRNTLIGAGIGAGVGAGIGAATDGPCKPPPNAFFGCLFSLTKGQQAAIFAVPGFVIGAAVGALWPTHEIIYRVGGAG
ncbi:MAG: hypothetical protein WAJ96_08235 [Candidatus Acidiferrum sp.]